MRLAAILAMIAVTCTSTASHAAEWERPDSPYRMGEASPDVPATCETAKFWIDHPPETDARFSFSIVGKLVTVDSDGALAYLVMCEEADVQVLCVTYSTEGREIGEVVQFGGGYIRAGERRIMLDPCLASPEE